MYLRNRKQLPLCTKCHRYVHKNETKYGKGELIHLIPYKKMHHNQIIDIEVHIKDSKKVHVAKTMEEKGWRQV